MPEVSVADLGTGAHRLPPLLVRAGLAAGNGEGARKMREGAVYVDGTRVTNVGQTVTIDRPTVVKLGRDETLGGGQGACPDADGPSAIHVAMSNTLNTPVEALETEFPLRVRELSLREGSGGDGSHRGGEGIVRELEALAPMRFSLIAERRRHRPRGHGGGEDGAAGVDLLNGSPLPSKAAGDLRPGDRLRLETPGGGGWS